MTRQSFPGGVLSVLLQKHIEASSLTRHEVIKWDAGHHTQTSLRQSYDDLSLVIRDCQTLERCRGPFDVFDIGNGKFHYTPMD